MQFSHFLIIIPKASSATAYSTHFPSSVMFSPYAEGKHKLTYLIYTGKM